MFVRNTLIQFTHFQYDKPKGMLCPSFEPCTPPVHKPLHYFVFLHDGYLAAVALIDGVSLPVL
jgi:hypothetical protein